MTGRLTNREVISLLEKIATLLEIKGENRFKIIAYKRAAENISSLGMELDQLREEELRDIPGIGDAIAAKIKEFLETGKLEYYEKLTEEIPGSLLSLAELPEMGPKRVRSVWTDLEITTLQSLEEAARKGLLRQLEGFGPKLEEKLLSGIEKTRERKISGRIPLGKAWEVAQDLLGALRKHEKVLKISPAGSLRRMQETIGDIDLLVASGDPSSVMTFVASLPQVEETILQGKTKTSVRLTSGLQVDVRVMDPSRWGTALQYFTGNQEHNVQIREWALKKGFSLSEYSLVNVSTGEELFFNEEDSLYDFLELVYIPPELRQGRNELELATKGKLPDLVEMDDIKGDLQCHTDWSDGRNSLEDMAESAMGRGLEYLLITDHSHGLGIAGGVSSTDLEDQAKEIDDLNFTLKGSFRVLKGVEVEVLSDGTLDLDEEALEKLDLVVAAVHSSLRQDRERITERILRVLDNPFVDILAHPTGRLLSTREGADADWERVFAKAAEKDVLMEINASPQRLDLPDRLARRALEKGCRFVISTDAHSIEQLDFLHFGVGIARRAGLASSEIANCWPLEKLMQWKRDRFLRK